MVNKRNTARISVEFMEIENFKNKKQFIEYLQKIDLSKLPADEQEKITKFLEGEAVAKARIDLVSYVKLMGGAITDNFKTGRHIELICAELQDLAERMWEPVGLTVRKMISMPPGASKSQVCSRLFPSWVLGRWPHARIILVGHGLEFARAEYGSKVRDIMRMEEYKRIFPEVLLNPDKQQEGRFLTLQGGEVLCGSLEAKIAGRRGHLVICDDALVEDDAMSRTVCANLVSKYMPNIRSRLLTTPACAELVVGTRWAVGDLFDYLIEEDKNSPAPWEVLKIPALLDEELSQRMRRKGDPDDYLVPDTSFWPEFQPTHRLKMLRSSFTNNIARWNATYMQNPVPQEGSLVSLSDFRQWKHLHPPECKFKILTADTAYTKNTQSDFTAFQLWGIFMYENKPQCILLDAKKGKWDFPELCAMFESIYYRKKPDVILVEYKASGLGIVPELRNRGLPVMEFKSTKDKIERMQSAAPLVKSGSFWVPMPPERADIAQKSMEFVNDIVIFPAGRHDDVADAFSQFVLYARDNGMLAGETYVSVTEGSFMEDDGPESFVGSSYTKALL